MLHHRVSLLTSCRSLRRLLLLCPLLLFALGSLAESTEVSLPTRGRVIDNDGILTPEEKTALETRLAQFDAATTAEIVVVIAKDLEGSDANEYTTNLGNKLGIGKAQTDNGIIILLVPSDMPPIYPQALSVDSTAQPRLASLLENPPIPGQNATVWIEQFAALLPQLYTTGASMAEEPAMQKRPAGFYGQGYIATGYGVEGVLPDVVCHRIIKNCMAPYVLAHENAKACEAAAGAVMAELMTHYSANDVDWVADVENSDSDEGTNSLIKWGIIALVIYSIIAIFAKQPSRNKLKKARQRGTMAWLGIFLGLLVLQLMASPFEILTHLSKGSGEGSSGGFSGGGSFSGGGGSFGGGGGGSSF